MAGDQLVDRSEFTVIDLQNDGLLLVEDGNHGEYRPRQEEFGSVGTSFIRAADMANGRVLFESAQKVNGDAINRIRKGIGAGGDVLLSHKGTVGKVALVPLDAPPFVCSPQTTFWRTLDNNRIDRRYLYAFMNSRHFHNQLYSRAHETDMAGYVSLTAQRTFKVVLPPIEVQKAIAEILGALDAKIELNRRMNETLESLARAIFKSWFVDFDPVRAKMDGRHPPGLDDATASLFPDKLEHKNGDLIPSGWHVGPILDQADLLSGGTPQTSVADYWDGQIPWASAKDVSQCGDAFLMRTDRTITQAGLDNSATKIIEPFSTVIVAHGATTGRLTMFGDRIAMNQTCYGLRSKHETHLFLYCHARDFMDELVHSAHGSVFDTITTRTFQTTPVLLPDVRVAAAFDETVTPIFERVRASLSESETLAALRDTLLPRLLSGELRVGEGKRKVAKAQGRKE